MRLRWIAAIALFAGAPAAATPEPVAAVRVERNGSTWTADYQLLENAPVWAFEVSTLPREIKTSWRLRTLRVLTPGVTLRRIGNYDALVARKGNLPRKVRIAFKPFLEDIEASYDPALALTDGSVALYADQFKLVPVRSARALRKIGPDADGLPSSEHPTRMTFHDRAGPVLAHGKREASAHLTDGSAYILFGKARPVIGPAMTTIIDPALPRWIANYLLAELPTTLARYRDALGPSPVGQPTLLVSWAGPKKDHVSLSGSVLPGMVVMTMEGDAILKPNDKISHYARWFVSHEAAHFWLGQAVHYAHPRESWITEGGAELLAYRATAAADPNFDFKARMREARSECAPFLANGGVASAYGRPGDFRAYYACGLIFALAAERASGGDFSTFVRALIAASSDDQTVTREEWLALLDARAGSSRVGEAIAVLLDSAHQDGAAALDSFIVAAGIADQFAP